MVINIIVLSLVIGLVFGIVLVVHDAAAAWTVLLYGFVGLLVGWVVWLVNRLVSGELDPGTLRELFAASTPRRRGQ